MINFYIFNAAFNKLLKNKWILFILFSIIISTLKAQVVVNATQGTATASYTKLSSAFTAINSGTHKGVITISITADIRETSTATINANGTGSCSYSSITISPNGGAWTISGAIASNPLIDFSGADNITIDGLNTGGNSLTLYNDTVLGNTSTSTIRFINNACKNTIRNCNLFSAFTGTPSSGGAVLFSIDINAGTPGNDSNIIANNNIGATGGLLPTVCIASLGNYNTGNVITNNNIFDYYSSTTTSAAIYLSLGAQEWTITKNKFYQTSSRRYNTGATPYIIYGQSGANSENNTISYNTFGYSSSVDTGTYCVYGHSTTITGFPTSYSLPGTMNSVAFTCIDITSTKSNGIANNIIGNKFSNFAVLSSNTTIFTPIKIVGNNINIKDNIIGDTTGNGSIYIASSSTSTGDRFRGIDVSTSDSSTITNNYMGSIELSGTSVLANICPTFVGILVAGTGRHLVSNNYIGNSTANNIRTGCFFNGTNLTNQNGTPSAVTGTRTNMAISSIATGSFNIVNNVIRGFATSGSAQAFTFINTSGTMTSASSVLNINNNNFGTASTDLVTYLVQNTVTLAYLKAISMSNSVSTTINIKNNDIRGVNFQFGGIAQNLYIDLPTGIGIPNNTTTIEGNTFTNLSINNTTGGITLISHARSIASTGVLNINNNAIVTGLVKTAAGTSVTAISSTSGATSATGAITNYMNNNFSNITVTGNTAINGIVCSDGNASNFPTRNISGNVLNNWTGGTSGIVGLQMTYKGGNSVVANNTITNITGQSTISGIVLDPTNSGGNATLLDVYNNTISNLSSSNNITGISSSDTSSTSAIRNNIISNLNSSAASIVAGISISRGKNTNVYSNKIYTLSGSGITNPRVYGIQVSGGALINIFRNKIYDLQETGAFTTGSVNGVWLNGGSLVTMYNNIIGDLKAPSADLEDAIRGISITSSLANSNYYLYNNTVYLSGTSSSSTFGTSGIYHSHNATSTTSNLTAINNLIVNDCTKKGALGLCVAFRRNNSSIANLSSNSNNNLYYGKNGVYYNGTTTFATLANFQANVSPADTDSKTETSFSSSTYFQSIIGSDLVYLKPIASSTCNASGNASNLGPLFTDDYNEVVRSGNWDIGALEFSKSKPEIVFVSVSPSFSGQCTASARKIKAVVKAVSGTLTTTIINYSYNNIVQTPLVMTNTLGDTFEATIPVPIVSTDSISWSIFAQNSIGKDSTFIGTSYADKKSISFLAHLPSSSVSGAVEQCTDSSGWTYYAHPSTPNQWIFGIYKNGNNFIATVDIGVNNSPYYSSSSNGANQEHASSIMARYWNVNTNVTSFPNPMSIRFFHTADEYYAAEDTLINKFDTLKNSININTQANPSYTMEWFKTVGNSYNPNNWIGNKYIGGSIVKLNFVNSGTYNGYDYSELDGITSFSGGSVGTSFAAGTGSLSKGGGSVVGLPVTWNEIEAFSLYDGNKITWTTENEKNTDFFEVQYSYDGKRFNSCKEQIKAAGNSVIKSNYQYFHKNELTKQVYYRIKHFDFENKYSYSKIVSVSRKSILDFDANIYPTFLETNLLKIEIATKDATKVFISVIDMYAKVVFEEECELMGNGTTKVVNLETLSSGNYIVRIESGNQIVFKKLIIAK